MSSSGETRAAEYRRPAILAVASIGALAVLAVVCLMAGKYPLSAGEVLSALGTIFGGSGPVDPMTLTVVFNIRLPRVLAAIVVGSALAASGATYQGLFRNPLVSPDILGVSAGASLGAVVGIFLSLPVAAIQIVSFAGGLAAVLAVYAIGGLIRGRDPILTLVLAGVAVGALVGAGISLIKILADPYDQLPAITYWLLGSLASVTLADLVFVLPSVALGSILLFLLRWRMNLLALGEDEARALGVETRCLRPVLVVAATLMTSAVVSITGVIGWIGLVVPHVVRMLVGPDFRALLPASMALGAAFLLVIDLLARSVAQTEIPLGILTAVVGAPFFLGLLARGRTGWAG